MEADLKALLALADGSVFEGVAIGVSGIATGEVVFNTALTGYQEILTDPSYCKQIITFTHPHIGNVGCNDQDNESNKVWASGLVLRDISHISSNWRAQTSFKEWLIQNKIVAIGNIDTRKLTKHLREQGSQKACIMASETVNKEQAVHYAKDFSGLTGLDLAQEVTTDKNYAWTETIWQQQPPEPLYHIVAYDYGIKYNILRLLVAHGCKVTVVPAKTPIDTVLALQPDGVFLSNGPGDPEPCDYAIDNIRKLLEINMPLFGICLGHQLLSLALGAKTYKMKFGHHGANHPVQDIENKTVYITSQNHGFAVDEKTLPTNVKITHRSLFDQSLQGINCQDKPAFSFQGHPEASPGPHDMRYLFEKFIELMRISKKV